MEKDPKIEQAMRADPEYAVSHLLGNALFAAETAAANFQRVPNDNQRRQEVNETKSLFFSRLSELASMDLPPHRTITPASLEQLRKFESLDWTDPGIIQQLKEQYFELLGEI